MPTEDTPRPDTGATLGMTEYVVEDAENTEVVATLTEAKALATDWIEEERDQARHDGEWSWSVDTIMVYERRLVAWARPDGEDYALTSEVGGS